MESGIKGRVRDVRFGFAHVLHDDVVVTEKETNADDGQYDIYP